MQLEPLIELRGVYKRFTTASVGSYTALRDLSFHAGPGVFCAVVGPAGCGKSTTVLAILRVLYHSSKPDVGVILMRPADRKVLFLRRRWAPYRGRWGLPGGFVAYGEHPEDAAVREQVDRVQRQDPAREYSVLVAPDLPRVIADEQLAMQVLANLLSNASSDG